MNSFLQALIALADDSEGLASIALVWGVVASFLAGLLQWLPHVVV